MALWHGCEQFHSQPDGTAGINADGDLTHSPDYPTASQTCARLVPERLLLYATLTISPSIATAGRHHRSCVPTSRCPHPHLLESGQARSPSLAHHPWCQRHGPSLRWIRANACSVVSVADSPSDESDIRRGSASLPKRFLGSLSRLNGNVSNPTQRLGNPRKSPYKSRTCQGHRNQLQTGLPEVGRSCRYQTCIVEDI